MAKVEEHVDRLKKEVAQLRHKVADYEDRFEEKVQEHPLASVGVAFGVGMLIGAVASMIIQKR